MDSAPLESSNEEGAEGFAVSLAKYFFDRRSAAKSPFDHVGKLGRAALHENADTEDPPSDPHDKNSKKKNLCQSDPELPHRDTHR